MEDNEQPEVNTLKIIPSAGGRVVWVRESKRTGTFTASRAQVLNAIYASGYVPRTKQATFDSRDDSMSEMIWHEYRLTGL